MWREGRRFVAVPAVLGILASLAPTLSGGAALGFSPAPGKFLRARNSLGASGCKLLAEVQDAKIWVGSGGHKVVRYQPAKTCSLSSCWQEVRNPSTGGKSCAYRRGAILSLDVEATPVIAENRVRLAVRKGYEPLNIPADVAGITSDQSGTGIILAVDRTVALLTYGAQSDTTAHPVARLARFKAEDKAEHIALRLRNEGCPQRPVSC
jgi:hypothetical protein